jgi:alanine dehydrogenase
MIIGVPTEIKNSEFRVGLIPASVGEIVSHGHRVLVQQNAGSAIDFTNQAYVDAGAELAASAQQVFHHADMIVKVKEPQPTECAMLRKDQLLFTFLHLAPDPGQTERLLRSGATCVAYETVTDALGGLPLLAPMSEVAGRMSAHVGAYHLEKAQGGRGILLGGVPGVAPAKVLIIGGGIVGHNAAAMAVGMGADVTILDRSIARLRKLDNHYRGRVRCLYSTREILEEYALAADLVIGAVLVPGAAAPKLLTRELVRRMKKGAVVVDVAIDQGGCFETSHPTTHAAPTFIIDDVVHYCVANMPGGVARTASMALNNATLPFVLQLAENPLDAMLNDNNLLNGLNIHAGKVTHRAVAEALGYDYEPAVNTLTSYRRR